MHHMAAGTLASKVVIKGQYAVHVGDGQVRVPCAISGHRVLGHEAEGLLHCVTNRQQGPGQRLEPRARVENRRSLRGAQGRLRLDFDGNYSSRRFTHA